MDKYAAARQILHPIANHHKTGIVRYELCGIMAPSAEPSIRSPRLKHDLQELTPENSE
jgi:hypothetical protein